MNLLLEQQQTMNDDTTHTGNTFPRVPPGSTPHTIQGSRPSVQLRRQRPSRHTKSRRPSHSQHCSLKQGQQLKVATTNTGYSTLQSGADPCTLPRHSAARHSKDLPGKSSSTTPCPAAGRAAACLNSSNAADAS